MDHRSTHKKTSPGPTVSPFRPSQGAHLAGALFISQHARPVRVGRSPRGQNRGASLQRRRIRHEDERRRAGRSAHHLARAAKRSKATRARVPSARKLRFLPRTKRHTYATIHNRENRSKRTHPITLLPPNGGQSKRQATTLSPSHIRVDNVERRHSLVVRIPRCGRGDLGSIPSGVTIFVEKYFSDETNTHRPDPMPGPKYTHHRPRARRTTRRHLARANGTLDGGARPPSSVGR